MMHIRTPGALRLAVPLAVATGVVMASCRDANSPAPERPAVDAWAERTVMKVQVHASLTEYIPARPPVIYSGVAPVELHVFPDRQPALRRDNADASRLRIHHFHGSDGRVNTVAYFPDSSGRPPQRVYAFRDGRIAAIISSQYRRYGSGWVRTKSKLVLFDSTGRLAAGIESAESTSSSVDRHDAAPIRRFFADVTHAVVPVLLPRPAYADDSFGCVSEWLAYAAASLAEAAALAEFSGAAAACAAGNVVFCINVPTLATKLIAASAAWYLALDKLVACREKLAGIASGGTVSDEGGSGAGSVETAIQNFISDSIARGSYSCTADGQQCTYY